MKKNLLKSTLALIAMMLCSYQAMAYDFLLNGIPYNITSETSKTVEVTYFGELSDNDYIYANWLNYSGDITIPETITYNDTEYNVTAIGDYALTGATKVTSIIIPDCVTSIGEGAFATCSKISSVTLGNGIKAIKKDAFYRTEALTQITLPASLTEIGEDAFSSSALSLIITLNENAPSAHSFAFRGIESATVKLPSANALASYKNATGWNVFSNFSYGVVVNLNSTSQKLYLYQTTQLAASVIPASETATITWASSNADIASVDKNGLVTANAAGTATITATATVSGQTPMSATCQITVIDKYLNNGTYYSVRNIDDKNVLEISFAGNTYDEVDNEYSGQFSINDNINLDGYNVRAIADNAFRDCDQLSKLTLTANYIQRYGEYAFSGCSNLETFSLSKINSSMSVNIEKYAFSNTGLVHINITKGITSIAEYAFANSKNLMTVVADYKTPPTADANAFVNLPEGATLYVPAGSLNSYKTATGWEIFGDNIQEYETTIHNTYIRSTPYQDKLCINQGYQCTVENNSDIPQVLRESSDISVMTVDQNGYIKGIAPGTATLKVTLLDGSGMTDSKTITVTDEILQDNFVYDITSTAAHTASITQAIEATGEVSIPRSVSINGIQYTITSLASNLFEENVDITKVNIPEGITTIPLRAFYGCINLEEVNIPSTVTTISNAAFQNCKSLKEIFISANINNINFGAFSGCSSLTEINVDENNSDFITKDGVLFQYFGEDNIHLFTYPAGKIDETYTVPSNVTTIYNNAFQGASNLKGITLHNGITDIYTAAFRECTGIVEITLPESVTFINNTLFYGCSSLKKVNFHSNIIAVEYGAFINCTSLESITIPETVISVGSNVFEGCSNLKSVTLPQSVTSIGSKMFKDCTSLESFTFPANITAIQNYAFQNCSALTAISIPEKVTSIGYYAFADCEKLTKINLPTTLKTLGNNTFNGCTALKSITLHNIKAIESSTFSGCTSLETISLPNNLEKIGMFAFYECEALTKITLPKSLTSIDFCAFSDCTSLNEIITLNPTPVSLLDSDIFYNIAEGAVLYVPSVEAETAYETNYDWCSYFDVEHIIFNEEILTGIENISVNNNDAQPIIYNIYGTRINAISQPGIYIINGKKVLVK